MRILIAEDEKDLREVTVKRLKAEARSLIADGTIRGGMIPKTECCIDALDRGVKTVHVLDGRLPHSLLLEIFTASGIGTMVVPEGGAQ